LVVLFHVQPLFAAKAPGELTGTEPATAGGDWVTAALMTFCIPTGVTGVLAEAGTTVGVFTVAPTVSPAPPVLDRFTRGCGLVWPTSTRPE